MSLVALTGHSQVTVSDGQTSDVVWVTTLRVPRPRGLPFHPEPSPRTPMSPSCAAPRRTRTTAALTALAVGLTLLTIPTASALDVSPDYLPSADIGFRDVLADGSARPVRNDLTGSLAGQVELAQSSTIAPTGNSAREMPTLVADRGALLLFTPTRATSAVTV